MLVLVCMNVKLFSVSVISEPKFTFRIGFYLIKELSMKRNGRNLNKPKLMTSHKNVNVKMIMVKYRLH